MRLLALFLLLCLGCSPERANGLFLPQDTGTDSVDVTQDQTTGDGVSLFAATTLSGFWAKMDQSSTCVKVLNATIESFSWNLALFQMRELWRSGNGTYAWVEITASVCRKTMTPIVLNLAANVPTKVLDTMARPVFTCLLSAPKGQTLPTTGDFSLKGMTLSCPAYVESWGIHFTDPFTEDVPDSVDDPRVYDQDLDGKPGVTLVLGDDLCDLLMVQRCISMFEGEFESDTFFEAPFESKVDQRVLEGTSGLCGAENESFSNPPRSRVFFMRMDGLGGTFSADSNQDGAVTCEDLRNKAEEMYQEYGVVADKPDNAQCPKTP